MFHLVPNVATKRNGKAVNKTWQGNLGLGLYTIQMMFLFSFPQSQHYLWEKRGFKICAIDITCRKHLIKYTENT